MGIELQTREIDGFRIELSPLPARAALSVWYRLTKSVSPSIAQAIGVLQAGELLGLDIGDLSGSLTNFFANCSEQDLFYFVDKLLEPCVVNGAPFKSTMDIMFQGRIFSLLKTLVFAIEVNYADFLAPIKAAIAQYKAAQAAKTALTSKPS